jgi:hypothetical protein
VLSDKFFTEVVFIPLHLVTGWLAFFAGIASGAVIGLFFHDDAWLGGYGSFRRRLIRLGHISFFGMGALNVLFATSIAEMPVEAPYLDGASSALIIATIGMPLCCALTAWRKSFRHLCAVPVFAAMAAVGLLLTGWVTSIAAGSTGDSARVVR